jgi:thiol-disulfide isomerase/thioredoxin
MKRCVNRTALALALGICLCSGPAATARKIKIAAANGSQYLFPKDLDKLKKDKCAFFHVWATWCSICMEEMPDLIKVLKTTKKVRPVVIDVSSPSVQDSFSKRWMQQLRPSFPTYLKPDLKDEVYLDAVDKSFSGTLPFSALFQKGKLLKKWTGALELKNLGTELQNLCGG